MIGNQVYIKAFYLFFWKNWYCSLFNVQGINGVAKLYFYVTDVKAQVTYKRSNNFYVKVNGGERVYNVSGILSNTDIGLLLTCRVDDMAVKSRVVITPTDVHLFTKVSTFIFNLHKIP